MVPALIFVVIVAVLPIIMFPGSRYVHRQGLGTDCRPLRLWLRLCPLLCRTGREAAAPKTPRECAGYGSHLQLLEDDVRLTRPHLVVC